MITPDMLIREPSEYHTTAHNSIISKRTAHVLGSKENAKKRLISLKEPSFKIRGVMSSKRISANKYIFRLTANNEETARMVARKLSAFNDIEINYSDSLDASELIEISKKPLWNMKKNADGSFILTRAF